MVKKGLTLPYTEIYKKSSNFMVKEFSGDEIVNYCNEVALDKRNIGDLKWHPIVEVPE